MRSDEKVRNEMGLHNVKLMIPFCAHSKKEKKYWPKWLKKWLVQGINGLQVYVMIEI
jgi:pyruvate,water dikinase